MQNLADEGYLKGLLASYGFSFSKSLGQNFLIDPAVAPNMAKQAGIQKDMAVLEIGPGIGTLTVELARLAKKVTAIEIDTRLSPLLSKTLSEFNNVQVIYADFLKLDLAQLFLQEFDGMTVAVCANLPYYITTPVIMLLLESGLPIKSITVMVQKEVAQRLTCAPGGKEGGAITLGVAYRAKASKLFDVSADSFRPSPKVDSAVIHLEMLKQPPIEVDNEERFFSMIRAAFAQRRKTLMNALNSGYCQGLSKTRLRDAFAQAGLDERIRGERLSMEQFAALYKAIG